MAIGNPTSPPSPPISKRSANASAIPSSTTSSTSPPNSKPAPTSPPSSGTCVRPNPSSCSARSSSASTTKSSPPSSTGSGGSWSAPTSFLLPHQRSLGRTSTSSSLRCWKSPRTQPRPDPSNACSRLLANSLGSTPQPSTTSTSTWPSTSTAACSTTARASSALPPNSPRSVKPGNSNNRPHNKPLKWKPYPKPAPTPPRST